MDHFRRKPSIVDEIKKQRILHVNDRKTLDHAVKILNRYFVVGLDAKVQRGPSRKYVTYIVLATSNELILVDVLSLQRMPTFKMFDLLALAKLLSDPNITKVGFGMSAKQQLIKVALGGYFLQGVVDMQEAFRAIEITNSHLTAPSGVACEGLRTLEKICYNLLDKQIPGELCDNPEGAYLSETGRIGVVTEAYIVFHAYVELERRVRPSHLQSLIAELLTEPAYDDYLKLCIPWNSVYLVENVDGYLDAVEYLKTCPVIGFDSEWKPTRCPGAPGRMALLQVASDDKVFLFDVLELHRVLTYGDWALLKSIFTDRNIVKLGFDTRDDAKLLKDFMGPVEMESVKDMALIMRALEKLRPEHMTAKGRVFPVVRGLSRLCNVLLGRPLNKSKKLSMTNWEKRPLAKVFLEYAALDAHCLVLCWRELLRRLGKKAVELIDISVIAYSVETEALRQAM